MTEMEQIDAVELSAEEESRIDEAIANAQDPQDEAVAISARYNAANDIIVLHLKTGQRIAIPREDLQGLSAASPARLKEVEILAPGTAIHWDSLMEGFEVDALRRGIYGTRRWMDSLAQRRKDHLLKAT